MSPTTTPDPLALMGALVTDDGTPWAARATAWQMDDARAMLDTGPDAPRLHVVTRPRGGSKTTDTAGAALVALLTQAPARSTSHAYARDKDQAGLLMAALVGLAHRSGLAGLLEITTDAVSVRETGARLVVEPADAASAFGHIPYLVAVDEIAQWPSTRGARGLWEAIVSGLPKRPDSRLVVITTSGDPAHWSAKIVAAARTSDRWRVSETPGPLPWIAPADLAEQRRLLPASSFARLHLNQWTAADDRLVSAADLAACVTLPGPLEPDPRHRYVVGVDLGLKNDRTVVAVCHAEPGETGPRVVLDRLHVLAGTRDKPVQLADVEAVVQHAAETYRARVRVDPWQAVGLAQRLRTKGVQVDEWSFTAQSVGRLAMNLHVLLREHRVSLPDDADLLDELGTVRLRESSTPGLYRMDHDAGHHDDRAVALGLAALALTERGETGTGARIGMPGRTAGVGRRVQGLAAQQRAALPSLRDLDRAARLGPRLPGGAILTPDQLKAATERGKKWR